MQRLYYTGFCRAGKDLFRQKCEKMADIAEKTANMADETRENRGNPL